MTIKQFLKENYKTNRNMQISGSIKNRKVTYHFAISGFGVVIKADWRLTIHTNTSRNFTFNK